MQIPFNLPHVFTPSSSKVDNAHALRALLDCLVTLNLVYLRRHAVAGLYQSGVVYGRTYVWEPTAGLYMPNKHKKSGSIFYYPIGETGGKKRADCKSLAPCLIAEIIASGGQARPVFRFIEREDDSGLLDFHILVQTPTGWRDPSRDLGMGANEVARFTSAQSFGFEDFRA